MKRWKLFLVFLVVVALGLLGFFLSVPKIANQRPLQDSKLEEHPELTRDQLRAISESSNLGLAYLENNQWQESIERFKAIPELLPESELAANNLAIAQTESFLNLDPNASSEATDTALQSALDAIATLRNINPDNSLSDRLEAGLAEKQQQIDQAVARLLDASQLTPNDPTLWYEIYRVSQSSRDPEIEAAGRNALDRLHELAPDNLFAFLQWMMVEVQQSEPALPQIVSELERLIIPLAPGIEQRTRYDVLPFIEQVKQDAAAGNAAAVRAGLLPIKNLVTSDDSAQSDLKKLEANFLEFVQTRFSAEIETAINAVLADDEESGILVTFEASDPLPSFDEPIRDVQIADINLDGETDLLILTKKSLEVLTRSSFDAPWARAVRLPLDQRYEHLDLADLDYDRKDVAAADEDQTGTRPTADLDVILSGESGLMLLQTELSEPGGDLSFQVAELADEIESISNVTQLVPSDLNNDGDLDLLIIADGTVQYLSNRGSFEFELTAFDAELGDGAVIDCHPVDWDSDIDTDVVVLLEDGTCGVLENSRHGTYRWQAFDKLEKRQNPATLEIIDADRNGSWDLVVGGEDGIHIDFTRIPQVGEVQFTKSEEVSSRAREQLLEFDFDNDGNRDLLGWTSKELQMWRGKQFGDFAEAADIFPELPETVIAMGRGDLDGDGDDDLLVASPNELQVLINDGGNQNHWLDVKLIAARVEASGGSNSQRINYYGYGSTVESRSSLHFQRQMVDSPTTRFGLGSQTQADAIRIVWTNGIPQNVLEPNTDQTIIEVQKLLGSCPYLYTWNGERFEFVTDLLWASPIGLQDPTGQLVPARPWEYLKIPGDMLQENDDKYVLQITEELWEAAYFDQVELLSVDHPADIDIYTNEKVGPPSIAEHKLYQVRDEQIPVSVRDQNGRDLLSEVRDRDDRYATPFQHRITQGFTEPTFLDIDFGLEKAPEHLTLFLTGWVYPTDTALNVALQENDQLAGPLAPTIHVPDENGHFVEAIPYCGFPGGKTKTIAIDLTNVFLTNDFRIRLLTSMELCWDQIFFTTTEPQAELITQPLRCLSADLHYRGISRFEHHSHNGPERYLYDQSTTLPAWPPMSGRFTRYGDVRELIERTDDKILVIGTGDEMTLEFAVPKQGLRDGWTRDFVLHNVGLGQRREFTHRNGRDRGATPLRQNDGLPRRRDHDSSAPAELSRQVPDTHDKC